MHLVEDFDDEGNVPEEEGEIKEMETMLAALTRPEDAGGDDLGVFDETEAAEILSMMIQQKKKTYTQSAKIKKDKEIGRGYHQAGGRDAPLRAGSYRISISELKQRTKCRKCGRLGHWQKECPNNETTGGGRISNKEAHFLEVEFEDSEDALFCYHLEMVSTSSGTEAGIKDNRRSIVLEPNSYEVDEPSHMFGHLKQEGIYPAPRVWDVWRPLILAVRGRPLAGKPCRA